MMLMNRAVARFFLVSVFRRSALDQSNRIAAKSTVSGDMQFPRAPKRSKRGDRHGLRIHELDGLRRRHVNTWQKRLDVVFGPQRRTPP